MIEEWLANLITGNLVGVVFGLLMYRMANGAIKENTEAIHNLSLLIERFKR